LTWRPWPRRHTNCVRGACRAAGGDRPRREPPAAALRLLRLRVKQLQRQYRLLHLPGLEAERPPPALVGHAALPVDHVHAVGHAAIEMTDVVIELVHYQRHGDAQRTAALARHRVALGLLARLLARDTGPVVRLHPPAVERVRLAHVNAKEGNVAAV